MSTAKFEKFEMKYGYLLPKEFKYFMLKHGGDSQFGSCRFEYPDNIINNLLRLPGDMDFHLVPFGDIGNGDYYCFYRYGENIDDYYVGIWLHETHNFVILASTFKSFMYKCLLDDFLSMIDPIEDLSDEEIQMANLESMERGMELSEEFGFDIEKVKKMKDEVDYHKLMIKYDDKAVQSLCYIGKWMFNIDKNKGLFYLKKAYDACKYYTAPYYIAGEMLADDEQESIHFLTKSLKTSLVLTGFSYWQEDFLEIPEDVHREVALILDDELKDSKDAFGKRLYMGEDPYSVELRMDMARRYSKMELYDMSINEYNNALYCAEDNQTKKEILKEALGVIDFSGMYFLKKIVEYDIRRLK